jgi:hypothetical protein
MFAVKKEEKKLALPQLQLGTDVWFVALQLLTIIQAVDLSLG